MMAGTRAETSDLVAALPALRGRLRAAAPLAEQTWFRVGGPAEVLARPADREDLALLMREKPSDVPLTVLGVASNTLVRDSGVDGIVLRLMRGFVEIAVDGKEIEAGAGALDLNVAKTAQLAGIAGLEFLSGVPGTIGGALRMNAGAYGTETADVLVWAEAMDPEGRVHRLKPEEMGYAYRHCGVAKDWIFLSARLRGTAGEPEAIAARIAEIQAQRAGSQPVRARTGGSTFKNPPGEKAWQLIDAAGCRGLVIGDAEVSVQHCNFLINRGEATAADLEGVGEEVRRRVEAHSGHRLQWEIRRIGRRAREETGGRA